MPNDSASDLEPRQRVDAQALAAALTERIEGEVRFDDGSRALYATDASNYRQPPIGVVIPKSKQDVIETVAVCRRFRAPILARGCGTSLAGQCCNVAVVIDMSKYLNRILDLDPEKRLARVEPGVILDNLRNEAERYHLTFAPDPSTHTHNTLGGMIGNNSCGVHSMMGGRTSDNIEELEILTYDGEIFRVGPTDDSELDAIVAAGGRRGQIYADLKRLADRYGEEIRARFPNIPRRVSGFALDELLPENGFNVARALVGSEATCVIVLEATVKLVHSPPGRAVLVLGYPDVYQAGDHVPEIVELGPIGLEGIDDRLVDDMTAIGLHKHEITLLPEGKGWLIAEFGGETEEDAKQNARAAMAKLKEATNPPKMKLYDDKKQETMIWKVRESGLGATAHVPNKDLTWEGWEDAAVPIEKLGPYLREFRKLLEKYGYECDLYGHFGQGCVHVRIDFDLATAEGIATFRKFLLEAAHLVVRYGGSLSGEHGDGQARGELLPIMYGETLMQALREFKTIWDPQWKMNPGKVIDADPVDAHLRLGANYAPPQPVTFFKYQDDRGSFSRALLRCVGIANCRRESGGTMCPSFMATHEEKHTTRGRARLLFEMLQGDVIRHGWKDEAVKESLDLCLACKGCKGDCPVSVDMATYKAEFLAHYYEGRLRPRQAYLFGFVDRWARLAALAPGLANFFAQTPGMNGFTKRVAGIAPQRQLPRFAGRTFKSWFAKRPIVNDGAPRVVLWPDTFNNHFHPETAQAAVEVLEHAGFQVIVPREQLCCGRPLYEWGLLDQAQVYLRKILDRLREEIDAGTPFIGLEPACVAVFRDELPNLFPEDKVAQRLSRQFSLLSEFLVRSASHYAPGPVHRRAIVHGHCHHKAIMKMDDEEAMLKKLQLDFELLDSGCCGMAGSFGFEKDKYAVSVKVAERVLLPAVKSADPDTLVIADGFSCREQIRDLTGRKALHLAEVMRMTLQRHSGESRNPARI